MIDIPRNAENWPFFGQTNASLIEIARSSIRSCEVEEGNLAIEEMRYRGRLSGDLPGVLALAEELRFPICGICTMIYYGSKQFEKTTEGTKNVYSILILDDRNGEANWGAYIGMTGKSRLLRFEEHVTGYKQGKSIRRLQKFYMPRTCAHLEGMSDEEARRIEAELKVAIETMGIWAEGGH